MVANRNKLIFIICLTFVLLVPSVWKLDLIILRPNPKSPLIKFVSSSPALRSSPNFTQSLETFPWNNFSIAISEKNPDEIWNYTSDLIFRLTPFLLKEPHTPINSSCIPPPLKTEVEINCEKGAALEARKIGFLIQLGFDVDTLEIHLNELFDVVDRFFIIESTHTHGRFYRKPLIWELIKVQPRFQKFLPKVVHFMVDDADIVVARMESITDSSMKSFQSEDLQERLRWEKFVKWNNATMFFNEWDLLGFGDCDEVASRETVNYLKNCVLDSDPIDVGIWFPFGRIDQAFLTDYPVPQHPFTLGDPTFWTLKTALDSQTVKRFNKKGYPDRNRGKSAGHVLGGMHMTNYNYLPSLFIKRLTLSEGSYDYLQLVANFPKYAKNMSLEAIQTLYSEDYYKHYKKRIFDLKRVDVIDEEREKFAILPWFYNCNRERYPAWEGKPDSRLYVS